ncbi:uncharacterized protein LOC117563305 isoform X5 [Drosophila albomicans]|uniref:Uncharacterized protein LOC117563305 isoform X5 n=1 Tax=Drosophila albomicans TaxID=7291 RepID=A0A9C6T3L1_DROAB|nr:uncharacterized protein LOC117563305 isoform X5 [Drosophila albomicans]
MGREIKKIFANKPKSGKSSATLNNEEDVKKNMAKKVRADPALVDKTSTLTEAKLRKLKVDNEAVGKVTKTKNKLKSKTVILEKAEMKDLITNHLIAAASEQQPRATKLKDKKANSKVKAESESVFGDPKNKANQTSSVVDILEESRKTHKVKKSKTKLIAESYLGDPKIETEAASPVEIPMLQAKKPKFMAGSESNETNFKTPSSAANMEGLPKQKPIEDKLTEAKLRKLKVDNNAVGKVTKLKNKLKSKTVGLEKAEMKDLIKTDLIAAASEEQPRALKDKKAKSKVNPESESILGDPKIKANQTSSVADILEESQKTHKVKINTECESNDSNFSSAANMEGLPKNKSLKDKLTEAKLRKLKIDNEAVGKVTKLKNKLKSKTVGLEKAEMKDLIKTDLIAAASEEQPRATKLKIKKAKGKPNAESESVLGDPKNKANQTSSVADILEESQKTHKVDKAKNKTKTDCESNDSNSSSAANVEGLPKNKPIKEEAKLRKLKVDNEAVGKVTKSKNKLKSKTVGLEKAEMKDLITTDLIAAASEEQPRTLKDKKTNAKSESVLGDPKIKAEPTSSVSNVLEESQKTVSENMEESLPKSEPRELSVAKKAKNKKKSSAASNVNKKIETGNKASPSTSNRPEGGLVSFCYTCRVCKSHLFRSRYILLSPDFIFD